MLSLIESFLPGTLQKLALQREVLQTISSNGPIGRRALANRLNMSERILRSKLTTFKEEQFILSSNKGVTITSTGSEALNDLTQLLDSFYRHQNLEETLAKKLGIQEAVIVSADNETVEPKLGQATFKLVDHILPLGVHTIAVMGGTTMKSVAEAFRKNLSNGRELLFVPARGGLGESVTIQANSIASKMAQNTGSNSLMLYAPDHIRQATYSLLAQEPEIKRTLNQLKKSTMVLFSIGDPMKMAERRGYGQKKVKLLKNKGAVGEAFGEFIDSDGDSIYKVSRIGLESTDLRNIPYVIATAGGKNKAKAIQAFCKTAPPQTYLVTDELCAKEILNGGNPLK